MGRFHPLGLLLILLFCFHFSGSSALGSELPNAKLSPNTGLDFGIKAGYRVDELSWNIAGNNAGRNPNILSELTWKDLQIYQLQMESALTFGQRQQRFYQYQLRGMLGWGRIFSGENRDSDFAGDGRTLEFSRSENNADDGDVFDASIAAGVQFSSGDRVWMLTPLAGYSYHEQNLQMTDGYQAVSEQSIADDFFGPGEILLPPLGPFDGLDSRYDAEWWGPWAGLELTYRPTGRWQLSGTIEYHWAEYEAEANWNLRQDLQHPVSFEHFADGTGLVFGLKLDGEFSSGWFWNLSTLYQDWETDAGRDLVYLDDGTVSGTRLNEVSWESFSLMGGLTHRF